MAVLYTLHGERTPAILRDVVAPCVYLLRQSGRRGDRRWLLLRSMSMVLLGLIAFF